MRHEPTPIPVSRAFVLLFAIAATFLTPVAASAAIQCGGTAPPPGGNPAAARTAVFAPGELCGTVQLFSGSSTQLLPGAEVTACPSGGGACARQVTDQDGAYLFQLPAGTYDVTARPPAQSTYANVTPLSFLGVAVTDDTQTRRDFTLTSLQPPPAGTTIESRDTGPGGIPVVYYGDDLDLTAAGCPGGTATYAVVQGATTLRSGTMSETSSGQYQAVIPALRPHVGYADVTITIDCPVGTPDQQISFDIYIDPSGTVRRVASEGGAPIVGATVTLFRLNTTSGLYEVVPDGSLIMSPANRTNPDLTDAAGHFGWDVIAGLYKVRAQKAGCTGPGGSAFVETIALTIPPPVLDLDLRLGEGSGACLAVPVVEAAARILAEMATFDAAGVTDKDA